MQECVIKPHTRSYCPHCFRPVDAVVVERSGQIYLKKRCPEHGRFDALIERDALVYRRLYNRGASPPVGFANLSISITYACNLQCPICYAAPLDKEAIPRAEIEKRIRAFSGKMIWLTGGEPTLRQDLPELIAHTITCKKIPVLITNGIRLVNVSYARSLYAAGLRWVHFSLNGFNDTWYRRINGRPLLAVKRRAVATMQRVGFSIAISFLYLRGENAGQLRRVVGWCLTRAETIRQLRVRVGTENGRTPTLPAAFLSDIIHDIAAVFKITGQTLIDFALAQESPLESAYAADRMPCHLEFDVFAWLRIKAGRGPRLLRAVTLLRYLTPCFGFFCAVRILYRYWRGVRSGQGFSIKMRAWCTKHSIDLHEMTRCPSAYTLRDRCEPRPFCEAVVLNEKDQNL